MPEIWENHWRYTSRGIAISPGEWPGTVAPTSTPAMNGTCPPCVSRITRLLSVREIWVNPARVSGAGAQSRA